MTELAIVLAGGKGSRLRTMVRDVPKPMAVINGRPFLEHLFDYFIFYNLKRVILSVGYKRENIIEHFGNCYKTLRIDYAIEDEPLGTGGGVKNALTFIKGTLTSFLIVNADTIISVDLAKLCNFNLSNNENATATIFRANQKDRFGKIEFDNNYLVKKFCEDNCHVGDWGNGGFYCFKNKEKLELVLERMSGYFSLENEVLPQLVSQESLNVFITHGAFLDIGVPRDYVAAEKEIKNWMKF